MIMGVIQNKIKCVAEIEPFFFVPNPISLRQNTLIVDFCNEIPIMIEHLLSQLKLCSVMQNMKRNSYCHQAAVLTKHSHVF